MGFEVWVSYQIRKIARCACAGNAGNVIPRRRFQRKPIVSDRGIHHGTCVTHVPWCMSGSLTCGDGENVPGIPGACAPAILRIWQEAHGWIILKYSPRAKYYWRVYWCQGPWRDHLISRYGAGYSTWCYFCLSRKLSYKHYNSSTNVIGVSKSMSTNWNTYCKRRHRGHQQSETT